MNTSEEVALITGGASGIGRAIAIKLAERGAAIVAVDRDERGLEDTATALSRLGVPNQALVADVSESGQVLTRVTEAVTLFGHIDTVVSAAGIAASAKLLDMPEETWLQIISVNLIGTYLLAKHAFPHLIARGAGSFTAIGSDSSFRGASGYSAYCASKHGVAGLVKCLALEYARSGVRSNAVCPGFVETPMAERLLSGVPAEQRKRYELANPSGRFARPEEVAAVVAHLSDPQQSYVNGMMYVIDGGLTAGAL